MNAQDSLLARRRAVVARGVPCVTELVVERGEGAVLTDVEGRALIDLSSGIGVTTLGHSDPHVLAAIVEQAAKLQHVCMHIATYEPYVALCERLAELLPHGEATKVLLLNSGAEAVENAIKIARQATGRSAVICFTGAFHGRTLLGMSLTSKVGYKRGCGPFAPDIHRLPFPDVLRDPMAAERQLARLREALVDTVSPADLAAILVEPVLGEGGFVVAPPAWLAGLRALCDEHGIVLIFDEVQTGFCRTGAWGAYQRLGVTPDLSTWAKALGGGLPISAVVGRAAIMDGAAPGTLGGTFGGNPVSCAAALATLRRMQELELCARAEALGARMRERLSAMAARHPEIVDVRGLGSMMAIELCEGGDLGRPAGAAVKRALDQARRAGVLALSAGVHGNVIRLLPPLTLTDAQLDQALHVLEAALAEVLP
ncbi:MAG: aspartate aminotransferase family protein [Alphaproteobacteria bacterium]|nr:aspartate aminotransferase family protein [Alphaproteobacteria bacterium]